MRLDVFRIQVLRFVHFTWRLIRREPVVIMALAGMLLGLWVLAEVIDEVQEGATQQFDEMVIQWLRDPADPAQPRGPHWAANAARDVTALGSGIIIGLISAFMLGYLLLRRHWGWALLLALSIGGGGALTSLLKGVFQRPRPDLVPHLDVVTSYSFPSGHAMASAIIYLTLGALLTRLVEEKRVKFYFLAVALLLTALVGISRVYVGVHYPTDVLAGWSAGMIWASLCWLAAVWVEWHYRRRGQMREVEPAGKN